MATRTSALSSQKAPDDSLPAISNRASRAVQGLLWWHILNTLQGYFNELGAVPFRTTPGAILLDLRAYL